MGDNFSMRFAGQKYTRDAFFTDGSGAQDQWGARLSGLWTPTSRDEIYVTLDKSVYNNTNVSTTLIGVDETVRLANGNPSPAVLAYLNSPTLRDPYDTLSYITQRGLVFDGQNKQDNWGIMGQYTHEFESFSTVLQYSHRKLEGASRSATRTPAQFSPAVLPNIITSNTAELRLVSTDTGALKWVGGLFYTDAQNIGWFATPIADRGVDPVTGLNVSWCPCSSGFFPNSGTMYSYAAYGQATWTPAIQPKLHFTGGLRYTYDYKDAFLGYQVDGQPIYAFGIPDMPKAVQDLLNAGNVVDLANGNNSRNWNAVQWRLGVDYDVTDASLLYASIATGYKSGGLTYGPTPELKPENLLAYEIGSKNRFLNDSLQLNASAWWYDYTDLEASVNRLLPTPYVLPSGDLLEGVGSTTNVGKVNMGGLSTDLQWKFTRSDLLGLSITHIYSRIKDGKEALANGGVNIVFNEGERLGNIPKWALLGRYSHTFELPNGSALQPALKYQWQSERIDRGTYRAQGYVPDHRTPWQYAIPARGVLDASLLFTAPGGNWDVMVYANNVTNKLVIETRAADINPASPTYGLITGLIGEPRTYGVIVKANLR
jgi:outer membrane receptor protein involved in Fe transport